MNILLASSSPYRKATLNKLHIPFSTFTPNIDESRQANESPQAQVARLAKNKALAGHQTNMPADYIIGSDQLACFNQQVIGKPGNLAKATEQLSLFSGQTIRFYTALCLVRCQDQQIVQTIEHYDVSFRNLSSKQIETYLSIEQPFDCAGSFKCEGLGISLFTAMQGNDPNTLIGLPLIKLIDLFAELSVDLFEYMS